MVVSNGIQTEALFETYRLLYNTESEPTRDYMAKILDGAGAEPDSLYTPRIAGVITSDKDGELVCIMGIIRHDMPAKAFLVETKPGMLVGISTYKGSLEQPESFDPDSGLSELAFGGNAPADLAAYLFDISSADYMGDDIRVCSIAGIRSDDNNEWNVTIRNRRKE